MNAKTHTHTQTKHECNTHEKKDSDKKQTHIPQKNTANDTHTVVSSADKISEHERPRKTNTCIQQKLNCTHITKLHTNVHTQNKIYAHTQNKYTRIKKKITHKNKTARTHQTNYTQTHTHTHIQQNLHTTPNRAQIHTH